MSAQHSPGPWASTFFYGNTTVYDSNGKAVANVRGRKDGQNGPIVTAAPDLLAALEVAEGFISGFEDDDLQEGIESMLATIRAAIEMAKGGAA